MEKKCFLVGKRAESQQVGKNPAKPLVAAGKGPGPPRCVGAVASPPEGAYSELSVIPNYVKQPKNAGTTTFPAISTHSSRLLSFEESQAKVSSWFHGVCSRQNGVLGMFI